jgi:hypothetical protein
MRTMRLGGCEGCVKSLAFDPIEPNGYLKYFHIGQFFTQSLSSLTQDNGPAGRKILGNKRIAVFYKIFPIIVA